MAFQDVLGIDIAGSGYMVVTELSLMTSSASLLGSGTLSVSAEIGTSVSIDMLGELTSSVSANQYVNAFGISMSGTGDMSINDIGSECFDFILDFDLGFIYSNHCGNKGDSMKITRYRGDNYPFTAVLSLSGNFNITGMTFKMSTQIDSGVIYTMNGSIINAPMGMVTFVPETDAVFTAGSGVYDIEGNDGTFTYTYEKGDFTLLDDVTV